MQKRILLSLLWGVIFSISLFSQNLKAEKITLPDSKLNNLYKIDSGVYRSEQPSQSFLSPHHCHYVYYED